MRLPIATAGLLMMLLGVACGDGLSEAERHNQRGLELIEEERRLEAIEEYNRAIELDANMAFAYLNRGQAYNLLGDRQRAIADLSRAIELEPNLDAAYFYRGNAYELLGESVRAIADYAMALSLTSDPYFAALIEARIESLERTEEFREQ